MDRQAVLDIVDSSIMSTIKTLTSKRALMGVKYIAVENIPRCLSLLKLISHLRIVGKLNFIFFINKRYKRESEDSYELIIGCRNTAEIDHFLNNNQYISLDGCILPIVKARKNLEARPALIQAVDPVHLTRFLKMTASEGYNKFFPTERIMEILIELDAAESIELLDGILLEYKHTTRLLTPNIIITSRNLNNLLALIDPLEKLGNCDISIKNEFLLVLDQKIWRRQMVTRLNDFSDVITKVKGNLIQKDLLTNNCEINDIRNFFI